MAIKIQGSTIIDDSRKVINASHVGIGTTNPTVELDVDGNANISGIVTAAEFKELYNGQYWSVVTQADVGYGASQVPLNQYLGQLAFLDDHHPNGLRRDGASSDDVFVNSSGYVGIGTTNATAKLNVIGDARITGILTVGSSSISIDGTNNELKVGTGVTIHHTNGVSVGNNTVHSSGLIGSNLNIASSGISTLSGVKISSGIITAVSGVVTFYGDGSNLTNIAAAGAIEGLTVIDQSGSTVGTAGSISSLSFEGSTGVTVTATSGAAGIATVVISATSVAGSDGQIQYNNGGSFGGAAQLYYDDVNNRLGINTSSPAYTFDLGESASTIRLVSDSGGTAIRIGSGGNGNNDVTLLRVDGASGSHDGESDSTNYGFSFKYLGSGSGNNNKLQILSDNQNAGTQVQAFTMLQDGKIGIANTTPSTELEVGGTITATTFSGSGSGLTSIPTSALVGLATDSQLLDGVDSTSFLRSDQSDSFTLGTLTFTTASSGIKIEDLSILKLGSGTQDFTATHNGTDTYFSNRTGDLIIQTIDTGDNGNGHNIIIKAGTGKTSIFAHNNGAVELWNNGVKKLETTGIGISIVGTGNTATITGPSNLVLDPAAVGDATGTVTILGDLQVDGTQTIINSTTLEVDDKLVSIAKSATNATQANGAGLEINGASATLTYASSGDKWVFNKAPYYNTNRILTTADEGTGNGLDADTLDSQEGTYYLSYSNFVGVATDSDKLDGQQGSYYLDYANFSGIATDSSLLDGIDSGSFLRSDAQDNKTSGDLIFNDQVKLMFGTNEDLKIQHDGATSYISQEGTGHLFIRNTTDDNDVAIQTDDGSGSVADYFRADGSTGEAMLYHYGIEKLATKSNGIAVSGIVTATSGIVTYYGDGSQLTGINASGSPWITTGYTGIGTTSAVGIGTIIEVIPYDTQNNGTLSFEGSAGQLFSITNQLSSGSIFSVNDISGIPSIDVDADGTIQLAPVGAGESVGIGTTNPKYKLHVVGTTNIDGTFTVNGAPVQTGSGVASTITVADESSDTTCFPIFSTDATGDINPKTGSNLTFNSSTGALTATSFVKATNSSGFLKADGTEDTSTYLTSYTETQTLDDVVGLGSDTTQTITVGTATTGVVVRPNGTLDISGTVGIGTRIDIIPYDTQNGGTLSFEGSAGQLFSITNQLSSGSIFSVNDISGIPSIDVNADGTIQLAPVGAGESVGIGTTNPQYKLHVVGNTNIDGTFTVNGSPVSGGGSVAGSNGQIQYNNGGSFGGASQLYYDDVNNRVGINSSTPTSTLDVGGTLNVSGVSTFQNNVHLLNNDHLYLGSNNDIDIYSDGSTGRLITSDTLYLRGPHFGILDQGGSANIAHFRDDASGCSLYHTGNIKLQTTNTGAVITGNVEKYDTLVGSGSTTVVEFTVTVAAKSDHRYTGGVNGASTNGYYLDGIESPFLTFTPGRTYRFNQTDSSNSTHQIRFYLEADKTTEYTENVVTHATAGGAGAFTQIAVTESTPSILYYQCVNHSYMGNAAQTNGSTVVDGRHVAAPNATVPVHSLSGIGTETNIDVALVPKGTGAILGNIPDGTTTGGDKRGENAVDLQLVRLGQTAVASGTNSALIGGRHNTASGNYSFIGGSYASTVSGAYSAGFGNQVTVSGDESYAFGTHSLADSDHSIVLGGKYASTRTIQGLVVIPASDNPHSTDQNSRALCQKSILNVYAQTANATPTVLRSDTSSASTTNQLTLKNNSAITFKATCVAGVTGAGNTKVWELRGALKRGANAASTALVGSVIKDVIAYDAGAAAWDVDITADTTNGAIKVEVTGQASNTIRWVCTIEATEMSF